MPPPGTAYILRVVRLTRQEQLVLAAVIFLLLTGWAVKACRTAKPPAPSLAVESAK